MSHPPDQHTTSHQEGMEFVRQGLTSGAQLPSGLRVQEVEQIGASTLVAALSDGTTLRVTVMRAPVSRVGRPGAARWGQQTTPSGVSGELSRRGIPRLSESLSRSGFVVRGKSGKAVSIDWITVRGLTNERDARLTEMENLLTGLGYAVQRDTPLGRLLVG
ncbi:hypothetical protein [Kineosporia babensis]|uniref:Uncharacterized protein n=1 Tax=Kineosporia babensis TaxID=499548 RepID=A0A9X1SYA2_9ACTN|nr:hypothetical protein [Kineosporia babensis]MCD5316886.1 hypothetical protein [Kineosporia babensis]